MRLALIVAVLLMSLSGCNLGAAAVTPSPAATPDIPRMAFNAPANNARVFDDTLLDIDLVATDESEGISRIELYVDGELLEEAEAEEGPVRPIFRVRMNWLTQGVGNHSLSAVAYREDGTPSEEAVIVIEVVPRT
jgi:hypothetical protein